MTHQQLRDRTAEFARTARAHARPLLRLPGLHDAADQLIRAAESAASNYRAAGLARSHAEFTSVIGVVLVEIDESVYWLRNLGDAGAGNVQLLNEAVELTRIFQASYHTARLHRNGQREGTRRR